MGIFIPRRVGAGIGPVQCALEDKMKEVPDNYYAPMRVDVIKECGWDEALLGLSLNKKQPLENMPAVAEKLAGKGGGHDQFLRHIVVWIDILGPLKWWKQMDKYHFFETQSESTMHTILHTETPLFAPATLSGAVHAAVQMFQDLWDGKLDYLTENERVEAITDSLPGGFMQRRICCTNYAQLHTIYHQRKTHKSQYWRNFIESFMEQIESPEYIDKKWKPVEERI
jgi:hypothetical protein